MQCERDWLAAGRDLVSWLPDFDLNTSPFPPQTPVSKVQTPAVRTPLLWVSAQWSAAAQGPPAAVSTTGVVCSHPIFHFLKPSTNLCHVVRLLIIAAYSKGVSMDSSTFLLAFGQRVKSAWCRCIVHLVLLYGLVRALWLVTDCCTCFSQFTLLWLVLAAVLAYGLSWCYADIISKLNHQNYHLWHLQLCATQGYWSGISYLTDKAPVEKEVDAETAAACRISDDHVMAILCMSEEEPIKLQFIGFLSAWEMWEYLQQCYEHNWALQVSLLERLCNLQQHDMSI